MLERRTHTCRHDNYEERFYNVLNGIESYLNNQYNVTIEEYEKVNKKINNLKKLDLNNIDIIINSAEKAGKLDFIHDLLKLIEKYRK